MSNPKYDMRFIRNSCGYTANEDTATAIVNVTLGGHEFVGQGSAVRSSEDKPNLTVGEMLAIGRAYQSVGRRIERQAEGFVKHQDDVRERRRRARTEKAAKRVLVRSERLAQEHEHKELIEDAAPDTKPGLIPGSFTFKDVTSRWFLRR